MWLSKFRLILLMSSSLATACYAELGAINVKSYLDQRLQATIPITNVTTDSYTNLNIGLATQDKFNQAGIKFSPELASLTFKPIKNNNGYIIEVGSTKPIQSPVLSFVLHYQLDNNDFYRQYTILLDPPEYQDNLTANSKPNSEPKINTNKKIQPMIAAEAPSKITAINHENASDIVVLPNYNSELVKQHKAQFDAKNFTYRTIKNEYTYQIAKFIQALYPNSNLTLNQIILALGLTNYPKLYSLDQAYESEFIINLPQLTQIQTIHIAQADDYLLNHNLTESQQLSLLKQISEKFNPHLTITSANLFATKLTGEANLPPPPQFLPNASATVAAASQPAKLVKTSTVTPPPSAPRATITEQIITKISYYRYYILAIISGLMIGLISMIMRKRKQALQATTNLTWDSNLLEETQQVKSSSSIDNSTTQTISSNLTETSSQIFTQETALDQDLITTLEQILALDENREDILLKLFELHLVGQCLAKAQEYYSKLLQRWADNQLGLDKLNELCVKFNFTPNNILSTTNNNATQDILANQDYNVEQTPSPDNLLSNDLDVTMNSNVENSLDNNMPTLDDLEYEEQLNLVRMYCQIDETEQATQIINNLLANSSLSAKVHQQIDNLKQELGL